MTVVAQQRCTKDRRKEAPEYTASRLFDRAAQVRPGVFLVEIKT